MTGETILIAAFSGRAIAQSARRAGYLPLVVDAFGDLDTREAANAFQVVPDAMRTGFRAKPVLAALDALVASALSPPIGLVLGSGFEDKPRLIDVLDRRYKILGCGAETVRQCKDPRILFPLLDELGIAHPETRLHPPDDPVGWITKRIGGSGGRHIRFCTPESRAKPRRYFQLCIGGTQISVSAVVADGIATDVTRQWCSHAPRLPFRYSGAVTVPCENAPTYAQMLSAVDQLSRGLQLKGLVSFDFIVTDDAAYLLEINPRPGASLDVIDTPDGARFHAHVMAARENKLYFGQGRDALVCKAAHLVHADRGGITLGAVPWPEWSADRGAPGTIVPVGAALATVFAEAETPEAAVALARTRLVHLSNLIYGLSN